MEKKICAISDIHGSLIDIPECDILCICGDILPLDIQKNTIESVAWLAGPFQTWLSEAPCEHVVLTWGNHDFIGERLFDYGTKNICDKQYKGMFGHNGEEQSWDLFLNDEYDKITILVDDFVIIDGIKIYGTPWCPELFNWAFYGDTNKLNDKFSLIPDDTDIIITHCPPRFGQQGIVLQYGWNYLKNFGCQELQESINKKFKDSTKPVYVLSGHIHSGNHDWEKDGNILYRNVSIKNEDYRIDYSPLVFTMNI